MSALCEALNVRLWRWNLRICTHTHTHTHTEAQIQLSHIYIYILGRLPFGFTGLVGMRPNETYFDPSTRLMVLLGERRMAQGIFYKVV